VNKSSIDEVVDLDDALREIVRLGAEAGASLSRKLRGLTGVKVAPATLPVLVELRDTALRLSRLADSVGLAQPTVTVYVQDLERKGLILRTRDENDRRGWMIELTEQGREIVEMIDLLRHSDIRTVLAGWADSDIAALARLLTRFKDDMVRSIDESLKTQTDDAEATIA
jgi:MarR family transcriptional regulator, organic hydroperoxide resistance regulator